MYLNYFTFETLLTGQFSSKTLIFDQTSFNRGLYVFSGLLPAPTTNFGEQKSTGLCSMSKTMCPHTFGHIVFLSFYHLSCPFIQLPHFLSSSILLCFPSVLYPFVCITSFSPRALCLHPFLLLSFFYSPSLSLCPLFRYRSIPKRGRGEAKDSLEKP